MSFVDQRILHLHQARLDHEFLVIDSADGCFQICYACVFFCQQILYLQPACGCEVCAQRGVDESVSVFGIDCIVQLKVAEGNMQKENVNSHQAPSSQLHV